MSDLKPLCKTCGSPYHYTTFCYQTRKRALNKKGKQAIRWHSERKVWMEKNPPDDQEFWYCHYCLMPLVSSREDFRFLEGKALFLTIDHIIPRSNTPKKRYDFDNMVSACYPCNVLKGSMNYVRFLEKYFPQHPALTSSTNGMR